MNELTNNNKEEAKKSNSRKILFILVITILALLNGFLWYKNTQVKHQKEELEVKYQYADSLRTEYENQWQTAMAKLTEYEGLSAEMDSIIEVLKADLRAEKANFENIMEQKRISNAALARAKNKVEALSRSANRYIAQMDSLGEANKSLVVENQTLQQRLTVEKEHTQTLAQEKQQLEGKIKLASVLNAINVNGTGVRYKNNGDELETNNYKKAEKLRICFEVDKNLVVEPGGQALLLRIIGPDGATIAIESLGSGTFKMAETGEVRQYTTKAEFNYQNDLKKICAYWAQNTEFKQGEYTAEVYHKGYKIGENKFEMKWGLF